MKNTTKYITSKKYLLYVQKCLIIYLRLISAVLTEQFFLRLIIQLIKEKSLVN